MNRSMAAIIFKSLCVIGLAAVAYFVAINWNWYGSPTSIASYLLKETPLGSSESNILLHLRKSGVRFNEPWHGRVEPNTGYPPNTVAGNGFISAVVAEYGFIFVTSVEAFYIFDSNEQLVEIAVRKTNDAL